VDAALTKIKKNGDYQKLWDKWFGENKKVLLELK
jgi:ABC-type amino acid transport substrate-binding protein